VDGRREKKLDCLFSCPRDTVENLNHICNKQKIIEKRKIKRILLVLDCGNPSWTGQELTGQELG
jgi:hypothetical protein